MKKLAEFSVKHPITILMLVMAILLLGYISFRRLGIDLFPDLSNPRIFVELKAGERPPEEIENRFVDLIESLAIRQRGVMDVSSRIRVGSAQITVEYTWDSDMDEAFLDLQKALSYIGQREEIDEITITQHDPNAQPIMTLSLSHPDIGDMDELRMVAEHYIRNELIRLEGVADVELSGQEVKEVVIETNAYLLEAYSLSPGEIARRIEGLNQNISGGSIVEMGTEYIIKGIGVFQSLQDIEDVIIAYREQGGRQPGMQQEGTCERVPVFLGDVATVTLKNRDPDNIVRVDGRRCLGLSVYKETRFNTVKATRELLDALERIRLALPGYELEVVQNQGEFIISAINEVKQTLLIGIILAISVLYVFLRRIGTTAIISIAIPVSIIATFNLLYFNGLTLNIMTLGGLALGAGMLVDNAIVVMESILRNREAGLGLREASIRGTAQVGGAITASTVTTIVVFLPIVYLHGAAGELFKDQAWTVTFALLSSLVIAILVIPMLSTRFLSSAPLDAGARSIRFGWYGGLLSKILDRRRLVIALAVFLVAAAAFLIPVIGSEFVPKADTGEFSLELSLPEGAELARMERTVDSIERIVNTLLEDDILTLYSRIGPATGTGGGEREIFKDENTAIMKIILRPDRLVSTERVMSLISSGLGEIPDLEARFVQDQTALQMTLGTESAPLVIEVIGDEIEFLEELTARLKVELLEMDELYNVETSFEEGRPEVQVVIDRVRAGLYDIGIGEISEQLRQQLSGTDAGTWDTGGERKDITLRLPRIGVSRVRDLVLVKGERTFRLEDVADIRLGSAPREIGRRNQTRIGKVTAHIREGKPFDHVVRDVEERIAAVPLPPDYRLVVTGEEEKRREAFASLKFALILSIILVYMVLASQFESLVHPFTIIFTVPLAGVGAVLMFFILGRSLNIMAYIGIIMLVGIAVNDSIILVDAINNLKREGHALRDAIIEAGRRRIRPIIMTSITTILALLPLTFGFGEGAALRSPMALAVIGGLVTSTILTLIVIPCVYFTIDRLVVIRRPG